MLFQKTQDRRSIQTDFHLPRQLDGPISDSLAGLHPHYQHHLLLYVAVCLDWRSPYNKYDNSTSQNIKCTLLCRSAIIVSEKRSSMDSYIPLRSGMMEGKQELPYRDFYKIKTPSASKRVSRYMLCLGAQTQMYCSTSTSAA